LCRSWRVGIGGYFFLLVALRTVGPRTIVKTNIFDFIVLVSIGSVYGRILTAKDVTLVEAFVAYSLLVSIQYATSWLRVRHQSVAAWLDAEPVLLYFHDQYVRRAMRRARVRERDVEGAVRAKGLASMTRVDAVVPESDGELSVLAKQDGAADLIAALRHQVSGERAS
jgi:uncharacterized membrane protein YcaP (DUF421 family)